MVVAGPAGIFHRHKSNPAYKRKVFEYELRQLREPAAVLPADDNAELHRNIAVREIVESPHRIPVSSVCTCYEVMIALIVRMKWDAHDEPFPSQFGNLPDKIAVPEVPAVAQDMDECLRKRLSDFSDKLQEHFPVYGRLSARNADLFDVLGG